MVTLVSLPVLLLLVLAAPFVHHAEAWSYNKLLQQTNNLSQMNTVRREPIKMPTETPMVPYQVPGTDYFQFIDLYSKFYRERTLMVNKFIDDRAANDLIAQILYLVHDSSTMPIDIYFNVPGAQLRPGLALYDLLIQTRDASNIQITTINLGLCAGMGAFLCGAGSKGFRGAMPNSRFLLQRTGMDQVFRGQASDIGLEVQNVRSWNDKMEAELCRMTGQDPARVSQDLKRDFYLSADEAVQYGLIDQVLQPTFNKRRAFARDVDLFNFSPDPEISDEQRWEREAAKRRKQLENDSDEPEIAKAK